MRRCRAVRARRAAGLRSARRRRRRDPAPGPRRRQPRGWRAQGGEAVPRGVHPHRGSLTRMNRIVVVGASVAGLNAAETLREEGFSGELVLVNGERHAGYDRPPLSKQVLDGRKAAADLTLKPADFYSTLAL